MGFKILIISPLSNIGTTTVSALVAQMATYDNKTSHLIYTDSESPINEYLGVKNADDPTRSVMQIIKLIDSQALEDKDILDYGHQYVHNSWILNTADKSLSVRDKSQVTSYIFSRAPCDLSICDCSEDLQSELTLKLIDTADLIFVVCNTTRKSQIYLRSWIESPYLKDQKNVYIICNRYNEVTYSVRNFAKVIVQPPNRICKIHYNPWVEKCCNQRELATVIPKARNFDPRVVKLYRDAAEIMQCINTTIVMTTTGGL